MPYRVPDEIPDHVSEWFAAKEIVPTFDWHDIWADEHAAAFTISKMLQLDLLSDMHQALTDAIADGLSQQEFIKTQTKRLQEMGWWGRRPVVNPKTGATERVLLGSPARLRVIYDTNLRVATAAGQWDRIEATQRSHPYLLYQLGPSKNHRIVHVDWHGTLLRADDPWWRLRFPPNGWGCKCWVRQVSRVEAEQKNWEVSERPPERYYTTRDPRTGLDISMPEGIEPGWDISHRRGERNARLEQLLADKVRG